MRQYNVHMLSLLVGLLVMLLLAACAGGAPAVAPATSPPAEVEEPQEMATEPPAVEPTAAPTEEMAMEGEAPEGTLTVGLPGEVNSLDPVEGSVEYVITIARQYTQTPMYLHPDGSLSPQLAESWEVEDDTTVLFHLRDDVTFTNGEPFNADAFEFSWHWSEDHPNGRNSRYYAAIEDIEKIDDYTVRVTVEAPDPVLLEAIAAWWFMYPPEYTAEVGPEGFSQHPIGTGPFIFEEWVKGDHITFQANPDYYEPGRPGVATLIYRPIPEDASRVAALQTGQIDIARNLPVEMVPQLEDDPEIEVYRELSTRTYYIMFNNLTTGAGTPLEDKLVRQALNSAVDRETIIDAILDGNAEINNSFIGQTQFGHDPDLEAIPYDPDKARDLLAEAGYADGFEIGMACPSGAYTKVREICQAIAGYLEEVGLTVELEMMESTKFWDLEATKDLPPLYFDGYGSRFLDPNTQIRGAFIPEEEYIEGSLPDEIVGAGSQWASWHDPHLIDLYIDQAFTLDQEHRRDVLHEMARYMQEEPGAIWLWQVHNFEGVRDRVGNYTMYPNDAQILWDVTVAE